MSFSERGERDGLVASIARQLSSVLDGPPPFTLLSLPLVELIVKGQKSVCTNTRPYSHIAINNSFNF